MARSVSKRIPTYLTATEVHRLARAATSDRDRMMIEVLWRTGGRISEVLALRPSDIGAHGITMPNLKQGEPAQKFVFVDADFLAELRSYCKDISTEGYLFARQDGRPMTRQRAWQIITAVSRAAGVFKRRFRDGALRPAWCHSLRHSNAVHLLTSGMAVTAVMEQLGHSSLASTQVYTRIADPQKEAMIAGIRF